MNIYDQAHELARGLKQTDEYREYMCLREVAYEDQTNRTLLDEYARLRVKAQMKFAAGERDAQDDTFERLQKLTALLQYNADVQAYMLAEIRFQKLLADLYKILADAAGVDLDVLGG